MSTMKDKYDEAVEYLTEHPEMIDAVWNEPDEFSAGCLFGFASPDGSRMYAIGNNATCGCLTEVKAGNFRAYTHELTAAIRADNRIPEDGSEITSADLPVFAEWQRRIDAGLGRR
jgi:hypothetical protein